MKVYNAIMRAADLIEGHPGDFNFGSLTVPSACGSPGCLWGWIGYALGMKDACNSEVARAIGVDRTGHLYGFFMDWAYSASSGSPEQTRRMSWMKNALVAAEGLRLYATKYHAPKLRPDSALVADLMTRVMGERIPEDA